MFLPNMITGQNIDLTAGRIDTINNISFVTIDQQVQITCMNDRIDVIVNGNERNQTIPIIRHIEFARNTLKMLMNGHHVYSNRLAINVSLLSKEIDNEEQIQDTNLGKKLCKTFSFYTGQPLEEWSTRANSRRAIQMDSEETLNVITEISSVLDNKLGKKRFLCHMDINTLFENSGYRFSGDNLEQFDVEVVKIIENIRNDFEEVNNG